MAGAVMAIVEATADHLERWGAMRFALWPWDDAEEHGKEAEELYLAGHPDRAAFLVLDPQEVPCAFAEAALRRDYVEGCDTSPVAFLEGIFVEPTHRRSGLAKRLTDRVEAWGREKGCSELASNALLDNVASHAFHAASGFMETERLVYFRRMID